MVFQLLSIEYFNKWIDIALLNLFFLLLLLNGCGLCWSLLWWLEWKHLIFMSCYTNKFEFLFLFLWVATQVFNFWYFNIHSNFFLNKFKFKYKINKKHNSVQKFMSWVELPSWTELIDLENQPTQKNKIDPIQL